MVQMACCSTYALDQQYTEDGGPGKCKCKDVFKCCNSDGKSLPLEGQEIGAAEWSEGAGEAVEYVRR